MDFIFTLSRGIAFPAPPTPVGWVVWLSILGTLVYILFRWKAYKPEWKGREWVFFLAFFILIAITNLLIGVRLTSASARPLPGLPADVPGSALMIFSAIPWLLGGGLLGPIGAAVLGAFAGLLRGTWDTYSLFSIVELAILGAWFSTNMRQRYRTQAYTLLRQPLVGAMLLIPFHTLFYVISSLFTQWGMDASAPATARLDFALSNAGIVTLAFGGEMLVGGVVTQIISKAFPALWGGKQALRPSPGERSLESRFLVWVGTFISLLLLTLLIGDWVVAGRAARDMLKDRLSSASVSAAQSVPFFLETGQNLTVQLASDPRLLTATGDELKSVIELRIEAVPYFDQFFVLDAKDGQSLLAGYPDAASASFQLHPDEMSGMLLASNGLLTQIYSIPPTSADDASRVSFLVAIVDGVGQVHRVLIGRTTLETNPLTLPLIENLNNMRGLGGAGFLLNENGRTIYHSDKTQLLTTYTGQRGDQPLFYDGTASDGTRQLVYYQPVIGRPWAVVLTVPAQKAQQLALNIAMPLSLMIVLLAFVAMISLRVGLRVVTGSLQSLATEANRIAQGNLDHPLQVDGVDEVGQLRRAFEQMRASLQARLGEINSLLRVSQGVASSLEMQDALKPVLDAFLSVGANSVSVVLSPSVLPDTFVELPSRFSLGAVQDIYAHLDEQILALAQNHEKIVLPNLVRSRELNLDSSLPQPLALLAVALRHENRYYGVLWAGFEQPRMFSDSDVRFVTTLAGQAVLAVSNAYLYLNVEASRRQLEGILNSTPDPVLVTDHRNKLFLTNRAAAMALGHAVQNNPDIGILTEQVEKLKPLQALLQSTTTENQSTEIVLPDKRTYLATASSVMVEGRQIGRVCIMRDVTRFHELIRGLERRFLVSEKMASSQDIKDTSRWILETLLSAGVKSSRIILLPEEFPEPRIDFSLAYGLGPLADAYASFDNEILKFNKIQGDGSFKTSDLHLDSVDLVTHSENIYSIVVDNVRCGVLWITYDDTHDFSASEEDFLRFMVGKTSQAVGNFKQYIESKYPRNKQGEVAYISSIFLSHSSKDKIFAKTLAKQIENFGIKVWLDDAELKVGAPLLERIDKAIKENDYVGAILSRNSIDSKWVQKEMDLAIDKEMHGAKYITLPILLEPVNIPAHFIGKIYADFTTPEGIRIYFKKLVESMGGSVEDITDVVIDLLRAKYGIDDSKDVLYKIPIEQRLVHIPSINFSNGINLPPSKNEIWIGQYPITNVQYEEFVDETGYDWGDEYRNFTFGKENHPAVGVSLVDAVQFCKWFSEKSGDYIRLPTELEWEMSYRISQLVDWKYPWGNEFHDDRLNWQGSYHRDTTRVGFYSPVGDSVFRVGDLAGNVWEWCDNSLSESIENSLPNTNEFGVLRGGSFSSNSKEILFESRKVEKSGKKFSDAGFRVVLTQKSSLS